jgi:peptidase M23-like protein
MAELTRTLKLKPTPMRGLDVEAWAAGAHRYLQDGQLGAFRKQSARVRETFGTGKRTLAKKCAKKAGLPQFGVVGPELMAVMTAASAFDELSEFQFDVYAKLFAPPTIVYPHASGFASSVCQGLHETAGLGGNWAIDFCARGGTFVVASEAATIKKLSGRDPVIPPQNLVGIWGWSIHYETSAGYRYFSTHYGERIVFVGQQVKAGEVIGMVGSWPGDSGRSHTHLGVTSPYGERDAKRRIQQVSKSPHVEVEI